MRAMRLRAPAQGGGRLVAALPKWPLLLLTATLLGVVGCGDGSREQAKNKFPGLAESPPPALPYTESEVAATAGMPVIPEALAEEYRRQQQQIDRHELLENLRRQVAQAETTGDTNAVALKNLLGELEADPELVLQ